MGFRTHAQFLARTVLVKNNNVDEGMRVINRSGPDAVQCSVPPESLYKKVCVVTQVLGPGGTVWGIEIPRKHSHPPQDDIRRIKKSRPTSVVTGDQAHSQDQLVACDKGEVV
ncbi:hypothetical protein E2C01_038131 [Portunus trituberculatus]|uniref:Uncharacterized protein n=1 Tax=Portunus trituberculatus TaxID=210409 RepID=A0A5B7FG05_PORTR|nr:hypothetical protein [Portunus trituberculatus]